MSEPRTVVISGGGTGIGLGIARCLAGDGERVVLLGRRESTLTAAAERLVADDPAALVLTHPCDVTDPAALAGFTRWLVDAVGPTVHVVVGNAGGREDRLPADAPLPDALAYAERLLRANLVSAFLLTHALLPHLARPGGRIIYLSSVAAFRGGTDLYAAAKAGLVGLARAQAVDLGPSGVTVNVIAPGFVPDTDMFAGRPIEDRVRAETAAAPVRRVGTVRDVALAARYLASQEAGYVTGEVHHVNGGLVFGR